MTETEQKAANIQRKALESPSKKSGELFLRLLKEITGSLSKSVQTVIKNNGGHSKY